MEAGIAAMVPGNRLTDVSHAIETGTRAAERRHDRKFGIVAGYGGHGIGRHMHMDPFLPNEGAPGRGPHLASGSVLAIEPMLTLGHHQDERAGTTSGRSSPPTDRGPRTGSTPSPRPTTDRGSSPSEKRLQNEDSPPLTRNPGATPVGINVSD